jgi:FMN phosphatase YigB (HAD superfamily)
MISPLVLDAGNVLIADAMPMVFYDIAMDMGSPRLARLLEREHAMLSHALWSGRLSEAEYWEMLARSQGFEPQKQWRDLLFSRLQPLVDPSILGRWSAVTPLVALSNHRSEWLLPALDRAGYASYLTRVVVSDTVGLTKPDERIFRLVLDDPDAHDPLFVDDCAANVGAALAMGWRALRADPTGFWVQEVDRLLALAGDR